MTRRLLVPVGVVLVTQVAGNDPNVGRLVSAVGSFLGRAAPELPGIAAGASTKRLMPALGPDESGLCVERSLLVGRSLEPGRILLRRGSHATRAVLRLERGVSGKSLDRSGLVR